MNNERNEVSKYRFECAKEDLEASQIAFEHKKFKNSINRSYYAIFHSIRAMNALEGFDSKKHSGVISFFNHHFIKSGKINRMFSKIIENAFRIRNNADYQDFYIVSSGDAQFQIENAHKFIILIEEYLNREWESQYKDD